MLAFLKLITVTHKIDQSKIFSFLHRFLTQKFETVEPVTYHKEYRWNQVSSFRLIIGTKCPLL